MKKILVTCVGFLAISVSFAQGWVLKDTLFQAKYEGSFFLNQQYGWMFGEYSGANGPRLVKTVDAGETWQNITANLPDVNVNITDVHFTSPTNGFVSTDEGSILYTNNGGNSWTATTGIPAGVGVNEIHFLDNTNAFALLQVANGSDRVYKSTDGGFTWISYSNGTQSGWQYNMNLITSRNNTILMASGSNNSTYRSFDGGATWEFGALPVTSVLQDIELISDTSAVVTSDNIFVTIDSLQSVVLNNDVNGFCGSIGFDSPTRWMIPTYGGSVMTVNDIWLTQDGGFSWTNYPLTVPSEMLFFQTFTIGFEDTESPILGGFSVRTTSQGTNGFGTIFKWDPNASSVGLVEGENDYFNVYPNPATSILTLENLSSANIRILDNFGKVVLSITNSQTPEISVASFANGMYFVEVEQEGVVRTARFVKN